MRWALKYNYAAFEEMRLKNPVAYSEWYQRNYVAQRYAATVATATTAGSLAASEADRASVHSGRSSVNDDHASMIMSSKIRGSTTGLDQSHSYDYNMFQVGWLVDSSIIRSLLIALLFYLARGKLVDGHDPARGDDPL